MNSLERDVIQGLGCIVFLLYNISEQATKEALVLFFFPPFFSENGLVLVETGSSCALVVKTFLCNGLSVSYVSHIVNATDGLWFRSLLATPGLQ